MSETAILSRARKRGRARLRAPFVLAVIPAVAIVLLVIGLPFIQTLQLTLSEWSGTGPVTPVGLDNFRQALNSPEFFATLGRTAVFSLTSTAGIVVIGTLLATAIHAEIPGWEYFRILWFLPVVVPVSAAGVYWGAALQPSTGVANRFIEMITGNQIPFLSDPQLVVITLAAVWIWIHTGFAMLIILGAMNSVPVEVYEAARVDGATAVRRFFSMTLPIIRPSIVTVILLELVITFNGFAIVWSMTRGGPGNASQIVAVDVYRTAFEQGQYGLASTIAVLGGIALAVVAILSLRGMRSSSE